LSQFIYISSTTTNTTTVSTDDSGVSSLIFLFMLVILLIIQIIVNVRFVSKRQDKLILLTAKDKFIRIVDLGYIMAFPKPEETIISLKKTAFSSQYKVTLSIPYWKARFNSQYRGLKCSGLFGYYTDEKKNAITITMKYDTVEKITDSSDILGDMEKKINEILQTEMQKFRSNTEARRSIQNQLTAMNAEIIGSFRQMSQTTQDFAMLMRGVFDLTPDEINPEEAKRIILEQREKEEKQKQQAIEESNKQQEELKAQAGKKHATKK